MKWQCPLSRKNKTIIIKCRLPSVLHPIGRVSSRQIDDFFLFTFFFRKQVWAFHMNCFLLKFVPSMLSMYPAGTWRLYNVVSTSMQRHDVASTLSRRCINVRCPLGNVKAVAIGSIRLFTVLYHDIWCLYRSLTPTIKSIYKRIFIFLARTQFTNNELFTFSLYCWHLKLNHSNRYNSYLSINLTLSIHIPTPNNNAHRA